MSTNTSSVVQSCPTLCNPVDYSTPVFPVHHQFKLMFIELVMPSNHLILSSRSPPALNLSQHQVFSNESALHIRWPKCWSFSFSIVLPMNIQDWFPLGLIGLISLESKGLSRVFYTTVQKHQFFAISFLSSHIHT